MTGLDGYYDLSHIDVDNFFYSDKGIGTRMGYDGVFAMNKHFQNLKIELRIGPCFNLGKKLKIYDDGFAVGLYFTEKFAGLSGIELKKDQSLRDALNRLEESLKPEEPLSKLK